MSDFLTTFTSSMAAGALAGCAVDLTLFPLDAIKTRLQYASKTKLKLSNIYSGLSWAMAASMPCAATFWTSYCSMKWVLEEFSVFENPTFMHFTAASFGSLCASLVRNPFEVIKQQMQMGQHTSAFAAPSSIIKTQGIWGLYAGVLSLVYREIPFDTIQMLLYEYLKGTDYGGSELDLYRHLINGAFSGAVAAYVTTPIDVAKTRLMTDKGKGVYVHFLPTIKKIYQTEGIRTLWSGWQVRVLFTTVGGMIFFGTFEAARKGILSLKE